ncbi:MAG: hypothetical protein R3F48_15160 [Candidatus Zixiibacteriota bacterium]
MTNLSGQLTARLADEHETYERHLIDEINNRVKPPQPLTADDVHIRAMYIVSDTINSQGGKFEEPEIDELVSMLPDAPVLVGHKRDTLPVARNFHAVKVEENGRIWVKSYFYWLKESEGAEDLRQKIDGGIYKECSISFIFRLPECSVCREDIRRCSHIPFQEYEIEGTSSVAHFIYRKVERVLETSLVFRGAIPDTHITNRLYSDYSGEADTAETVTALFSKTGESEEYAIRRHSFRDTPISIISFDSLPQSIPGTCYIYPYQPGISVRVKKVGRKVDIETPHLFSQSIRNHLSEIVGAIGIENCRFDAVVYAVKGKNRLDGFGLMRCLERDDQRYRLRLRVMDVLALGEYSYDAVDFITRQRILRDNRLVFSSAGVDVLRPEMIDKNTSLERRLAGYRGQYRFGCELMIVSPGDRLQRVICPNSAVIPTIVKGIFTGKESQTVCQVTSLNANAPANTVPIRTGRGLSEGMVVLASVQGKSNRIVGVHDVMPGIDVGLLDLPQDLTDEAEIRLLHDDTNLYVHFFHDGRFRSATVYQFTERLFTSGRRFIADVIHDRNEMPECRFGDRVQAKSISNIDGMFILRLMRPMGHNGDITGFVFRPVLIDGVERYLCYAPEFSHLPEE